MGLARWWDETVVPRIIRCGCAQAPIMEIRKDVVPLASGRVLELGCGGGINQQLYDPARIEDFAGLDPSGKGLDYARAAAEEKGWSADIRQGVAEDIPFADESFDTVVCTFTLCSVHDHGRSLSELRRVLRPGGKLFLTAFIIRDADELTNPGCDPRLTGFERLENQPCWHLKGENPMAAVGFDDGFIDGAMANAGFTLAAKSFGTWHGDPADHYQDFLIAEKLRRNA